MPTKSRSRRPVNVVAGLSALSLLAGAATAAPTPAPPRAASPTQVLARLAAAGAHNELYLATSPTDSVDVDAAADRSLAPYLYVAGGDPTTERLPLKETSAHVDVSGVIAHVAVKQVFENGGAKPIEAVYVFPASTRAAVHGMRMKIGGRLVEARIDRRATARQTYETARAQGKRTSLLEQERPNVFTMNVANIMPGDRIEVQLDYSELLVPVNATYEFVFPTVVGPRYTGGADAQKDKWMANPHLPAGAPSPVAFGIEVHLETGVGLKEVTSPSHAIDVAYASTNSADVKLRASQGAEGNRDFVLRYRLAGDEIETGMLLSPRGAGGEGYFALMIEPPRRPTPSQIPGREYIFLLDVSGSMHGFPLDTAKALMHKLLTQLRPSDHFDVALFSGANFVMSPSGSVPATAANIRDALELIERQHGGGGTELMGGLRAAYAVPRQGRAISRSVVVVTDGYVGVEAEAFRFVREHLDDANLFSFGIGSSVNRALIEGLARAGRGEPFVVLKPEKAEAEADRLRTYIEQPVLTHVTVAFEGFHTTEVSPQKVPDLLARRPVVLFGKYQGEPGGQVRVSGFAGGGAPFSQVLPVHASDAHARNEALRWLWARSWVATLEDELHLGGGQPVEDAITDLGLRHSLLTPFTSFVAVDREIANHAGQPETVRQPLPMPEGVSNLAVGEQQRSAGSVGMMGVFGGVASGGGLRARGIGAAAASPAPMPSRLGGHASLAKRRAVMDVERAEADAPASPVAQSPTKNINAPRAAKGAKDDAKPKAEKAPAEPAKKKDCAGETTPCFVESSSATGLASPEALVAALEARLASLSKRCPKGHVVLKLTVDAGGKVTSVEILSGDTKVGAFLRRELVGLTSGATARATSGTWTASLYVR
ncbi:MAG: von Willebrand factor type like domain [Myxococcales bacterium]|nr:von Willebrand factor type like domain [Myxococcales bacterium]